MSVPMEEPSRTSKALGPRPATALRRAEIVRAAADVFAEKGFAHGTLHEIADRVGMTHAGVLHHHALRNGQRTSPQAAKDPAGRRRMNSRSTVRPTGKPYSPTFSNP